MANQRSPLEPHPSHCTPARRQNDEIASLAYAAGVSREHSQQDDAALVPKKPAEFTRPLSQAYMLLLVLNQDEQVGMQFVRMLRQHTTFQAILARSLSEVHHILAHLKCDLLLLTDSTFPEEDLDRLYLLPPEVEPPALLDLTFLCWTYNYQEAKDVRSVVKALNLLLSARDAPQELLSSLKSRPGDHPM